jgi:hypothetical protein
MDKPFERHYGQLRAPADTLSMTEAQVTSTEGDEGFMRVFVSLDDPVRVTRPLDEFHSVSIGRFPPISATMDSICIGDTPGYGFLSRHALTITNGNDRLTVENRQKGNSGRLAISQNGAMVPIPAEGVVIRPVPTDTLVRVHLLDVPERELTIHIKAVGGPSQGSGATTRGNADGGVVRQEWVIAINAVECARRAGEKLTARSAIRYFHKEANHLSSNFRAFNRAYGAAGQLLLQDPKAGKARLLEVAGRYIDPVLIQRMIENAGG